MEMNAVSARFQPSHGLIQFLTWNPPYEGCKFTQMCIVRPFRAFDVIAQHMREVSLRSRFVEREPLVRHRHKEQSAGAQHLEVSSNRADWVLCMFEEMIGDDEILAVGSEGRQFFPIIDNFDLYQRKV